MNTTASPSQSEKLARIIGSDLIPYPLTRAIAAALEAAKGERVRIEHVIPAAVRFHVRLDVAAAGCGILRCDKCGAWLYVEAPRLGDDCRHSSALKDDRQYAALAMHCIAEQVRPWVGLMPPGFLRRMSRRSSS